MHTYLLLCENGEGGGGELGEEIDVHTHDAPLAVQFWLVHTDLNGRLR